MYLFLVRIELRGSPSPQDYDVLHRQMAVRGFSQTAQVNGVPYHLPRAEYAKNTADAIVAILAQAQQAASVVPYESEILVSQVTQWTQSGLKSFGP